MGCRFLLQGIFLTQGLNPHLLHLLNWLAYSSLAQPPEKPLYVKGSFKNIKTYLVYAVSSSSAWDWELQCNNSTSLTQLKQLSRNYSSSRHSQTVLRSWVGDFFCTLRTILLFCGGFFVVVVFYFCTHSSIHYFSEPLLQLTETMKSALADTQGSCQFSSQSVTTASRY